VTAGTLVVGERTVNCLLRIEDHENH
jgi:hypothetical protein